MYITYIYICDDKEIRNEVGMSLSHLNSNIAHDMAQIAGTRGNHEPKNNDERKFGYEESQK